MPNPLQISPFKNSDFERFLQTLPSIQKYLEPLQQQEELIDSTRAKDLISKLIKLGNLMLEKSSSVPAIAQQKAKYLDADPKPLSLLIQDLMVATFSQVGAVDQFLQKNPSKFIDLGYINQRITQPKDPVFTAVSLIMLSSAGMFLTSHACNEYDKSKRMQNSKR